MDEAAELPNLWAVPHAEAVHGFLLWFGGGWLAVAIAELKGRKMIGKKFARSGAGRGFTVLASVAMAMSANADWTAVRLNGFQSAAYGVGGEQQVGRVQTDLIRATLWTGAPGTAVSLHPAGKDMSTARDSDGGRQVGYVADATFGGKAHASLWAGNAASWIDLNPAGSLESFAFAISGAEQIGHARFGSTVHAGLWRGSADSWVDLNPQGATSSMALGGDGRRQVGKADLGGERAGLWNGNSESWTDLHPVGASYSVASGIDGATQVGSAQFGSVQRAGLWSGTAQSWRDLSQPGWSSSYASGVSGNTQAGVIVSAGVSRASAWFGSPETWSDLHSLLPSAFTSSAAWGVWEHEGTSYVVGEASADGDIEAILWIGTPVPEPSGALLLGGGCAVVQLFRRYRRSATGRG